MYKLFIPVTVLVSYAQFCEALVPPGGKRKNKNVSTALADCCTTTVVVVVGLRAPTNTNALHVAIDRFWQTFTRLTMDSLRSEIERKI